MYTHVRVRVKESHMPLQEDGRCLRTLLSACATASQSYFPERGHDTARSHAASGQHLVTRQVSQAVLLEQFVVVLDRHFLLPCVAHHLLFRPKEPACRRVETKYERVYGCKLPECRAEDVRVGAVVCLRPRRRAAASRSDVVVDESLVDGVGVHALEDRPSHDVAALAEYGALFVTGRNIDVALCSGRCAPPLRCIGKAPA